MNKAIDWSTLPLSVAGGGANSPIVIKLKKKFEGEEEGVKQNKESERKLKWLPLRGGFESCFMKKDFCHISFYKLLSNM